MTASLATVLADNTAALPFRLAFASRYRKVENARGAAEKAPKMSAIVEVIDGGAPLYLVVTPALGQRAERTGFPVAYVPRAAH